MKIFIIKLLILVSLLSGQIIAQNPGDLDVSFGESGIVKSEIGQRSKIHTIALQQDTKILAAGEYGPPNDTPRIVIARYHNNGQLDQNFGNLGVVVLPTLINQFEKANSILIQNNGKIIVGCIVTGLPGTTNGSVYIRLNPDGS
ncbi:MAG: delta-60 repeat domain-containing protein, partial [Saprospiraceae bacterium]|nr:delta-60 repeat domain-containing protein [Saprospiraceae bacterium]